ncbi:MAG: GntR family transcriptional regulator [Caldilineaceae bacterium]
MTIDRLAQVLTPTVKRSLSEEVAERLRDAIVHGQLEPDEPLRESAISELMGISRGPVREALAILEREGLVSATATGRISVARLSPAALDDAFCLRKALERTAIEYACCRATLEDIERLQAVMDETVTAASSKVPARDMAELDVRFHDGIYLAAHHRRLLDFWNMLRPQIYVFLLRRNLVEPAFRKAVVSGHRDILAAIAARDKALALTLIETHMAVAYQLVTGRQVDDYPC